ncbi:hypothetical protein F8388_001549 [Cannabis sativa]|uniref:Uncharacterized protein n=1 Tax=Cannabis sativa TaxID=3483 RepID=A0A7J6HIS2_CANSA|nr:hypothetical protein F8388_001549 [Cannabis sativa]
MEIMLEEKLSSSKLKASSHIESHASGLYGKPFSYYNKLAEIYGRDRATRTNAEFGVDYNTIGGGDDEEIDEFDGVSHTQQPINMRRKSTGSTTSNQ